MNQTMHVILKSDLARGKMSLLKHERKVSKLLTAMSKRHGVRIYKMANVGNHIHIHLQVTKRLVWKGFISGLTGGIARAVGFKRADAAGTRSKGEARTNSDDRGFWNARPFSRAISWGREFTMIGKYLRLNELEANGAIPSRRYIREGADWQRLVELFKDD
jgi:REP element-mobilizing transposase RayT